MRGHRDLFKDISAGENESVEELLYCVATHQSMSSVGRCHSSLQTVKPKTCHGTEKECQMLLVFLATGKCNDWESDRYYGSSERIRGPSNFCLIAFCSLGSVNQHPERPPSPTCINDLTCNCDEPHRPHVEIKISQTRVNEELIQLDAYYSEDNDRFILNDVPALRGLSAVPAQFSLNHHPVFCYSSDGDCVRESVANTLHAIVGETVVLGMLRIVQVMFRGLGDASACV